MKPHCLKQVDHSFISTCTLISSCVLQVVVKVTNNMRTDGISIHWHGQYIKKVPWMDGVSYITQCPILPRQSFTYKFRAEPAGTHW